MENIRGSLNVKHSLVLLAVTASAAALPAGAQAAGALIPVSGLASEYGTNLEPLPGATVSVAEKPSLKATVNRNGAFSIRVPRDSKSTIVIEAPGHIRMYSDTRVRKTGDPRVVFGVPSLALAGALAGAANIPLNSSGTAPRKCMLFSLVVQRAARGFRSLADAKAFGPSGVAGAALSLTKGGKAVPNAKALYFKQGVPDPSLTSTVGGTGIFSGLESGTYNVTARKAGSRFDSYTAVCKPGRLIVHGIFSRN